MTSDVRAVVDTNVVVSAALLRHSVPRRAFDWVLDHGKLLTSAATIEELNDVLRRKRFDKYVHEDERLEFLAALIRASQLVDVTATVTDCRDPKDNKILEAAVSGNATHIITGDPDLLVLNPFRGIPIVTPHDFLTEAERKDG